MARMNAPSPPEPALVDSHCHLDRLRDVDDATTLAPVLERARARGVTHCLCVCVTLEDFPAMSALVAPFPEVSISAGAHPNEPAHPEGLYDRLLPLARQSRVVAVGETGLDYHYGSDTAAEQQDAFRQHIAVARETGRPLIVHTREARRDTIEILRQEGAAEVGGVLHCFTEDWDMARRGLDLGFMVSFSGIVTFRNAGDLREVARQVPADRLLVETDSPWLAPVPVRGHPNEPANVRYVAERVAEVRGVPLETLARQTTDNFFRLFRRAGGDD